MSGRGEGQAMSDPEPTVAEVVQSGCRRVEHTLGICACSDVIAALGLDADLRVSVLRARLAAGARLEDIRKGYDPPEVLTDTERWHYASGFDAALAWIRGENQ